MLEIWEKERSCLLCGVSRCSEDGKNIRIVDEEESPFAGILIAFRQSVRRLRIPLSRMIVRST